MTFPCINLTIKETSSIARSDSFVGETGVLSDETEHFESTDTATSGTILGVASIACWSIWIEFYTSTKQDSFEPAIGFFNEVEFGESTASRKSFWTHSKVFVIVISGDIAVTIGISEVSSLPFGSTDIYIVVFVAVIIKELCLVFAISLRAANLYRLCIIKSADRKTSVSPHIDAYSASAKIASRSKLRGTD